MTPRIPMDERFWSNVVRNGPGECWSWTAGKSTDGYGQLRLPYPNRRKIGAHRYSFLLHYGPFDKRLIVCHRCDNPECTNPEHLFLGTHQDNAVDRTLKARGARQDRTHCPHGHEMTEENTYRPPDRINSRVCLECHRAAMRGRPAQFWRDYRAKRAAEGRPIRGARKGAA